MKRLIATIAALFIFLIISFSYGLQQKQAQTKIPTIGILQTMSHPALDQIHRGILIGLKKEGYVNGKNLKIDFQNAQNDQSNLKQMSDRFQNENARLTIGIATPAVQSLANESGQTPIVMGAISDPLATGLVKSLHHPGGRVTGVQDKQPLKAQLELIQTILPHLKRIGIIYTSSDDSSTSEAQDFKKLAQARGLQVATYTITSTNDIEQVAQTMTQKVQAIYVPTDNTVASGFSALLKAANSAKIPIFPAADTMIKQGGLASRSVSQVDMGILTGEIAGQILKGKKPSDIPIQRITHYQTVINQATAKQLNIHLPQSVTIAAKKKGMIYQ